jgi:hypothetical protein
MDDIVTDVNEGWNEEHPKKSMQCVCHPSFSGLCACELTKDCPRFKGSDDYLRLKVS